VSRAFVLALAAGLAFSGHCALAQQAPPVSDDWIVTLKGRAYAYPAYPGASSMSLAALPGLGLRRAGTEAPFAAPDDNLSLALYDIGWLKAGPVGKFIDARTATDHAELHGLHTVDWTIEAGAFVEIWPMKQLRTRFEVRRGFNGEQGVEATASADWVERRGAWTFSGGPRIVFANDRYTNAYFSVSPSEAALNGTVTPFTARGGLHSVGLALAATYQWNDAWSTTLYGNYDRLTQDAAKSPITSKLGSPDQLTVGVIVSYAFGVKGF
jgi:outer membrane scaffolding protein for murein synthesis (MipA/OmpV family)